MRHGVEVSALAEQLAALPEPLVLRRRVEDVADAVHEVLSAVVGLLAESKHLDAAAQARTVHTIADLARRPHEPEVTDAQITSGSWARTLTRHVQPFTADLAALLGRALPPDAPALGSRPSASERLTDALRVLDTAALELGHRLPRAAARQALGSFADHQRAQRERYEAQQLAARLARLGLPLTNGNGGGTGPQAGGG